jgi:hypothetical protein
MGEVRAQTEPRGVYGRGGARVRYKRGHAWPWRGARTGAKGVRKAGQGCALVRGGHERVTRGTHGYEGRAHTADRGRARQGGGTHEYGEGCARVKEAAIR